MYHKIKIGKLRRIIFIINNLKFKYPTLREDSEISLFRLGIDVDYNFDEHFDYESPYIKRLNLFYKTYGITKQIKNRRHLQQKREIFEEKIKTIYPIERKVEKFENNILKQNELILEYNKLSEGTNETQVKIYQKYPEYIAKPIDYRKMIKIQIIIKWLLENNIKTIDEIPIPGSTIIWKNNLKYNKKEYNYPLYIEIFFTSALSFRTHIKFIIDNVHVIDKIDINQMRKMMENAS